MCLVLVPEQQMQLDRYALVYIINSRPASDICGDQVCKGNYLAIRKSSNSLRSSLQIYSLQVPTGLAQLLQSVCTLIANQ